MVRIYWAMSLQQRTGTEKAPAMATSVLSISACFMIVQYGIVAAIAVMRISNPTTHRSQVNLLDDTETEIRSATTEVWLSCSAVQVTC